MNLKHLHDICSNQEIIFLPMNVCSEDISSRRTKSMISQSQKKKQIKICPEKFTILLFEDTCYNDFHTIRKEGILCR